MQAYEQHHIMVEYMCLVIMLDTYLIYFNILMLGDWCIPLYDRWLYLGWWFLPYIRVKDRSWLGEYLEVELLALGSIVLSSLSTSLSVFRT
jgi:hypothetical protein